MSDRLTLTRAFEGAGLKSADAEKIATEIYDAIHDNVATKADVTLVHTEITLVRADLRDLEQRLKLWLGSFIAAAGALLFAALHYWPPHGLK